MRDGQRAGVGFGLAAREALVAAGGIAVGSPAELPGDLVSVLILVVNAAQEEGVLFGPTGCVARLAPGTVVICSVTVAPEAARRSRVIPSDRPDASFCSAKARCGWPALRVEPEGMLRRP